jgi:transposase
MAQALGSQRTIAAGGDGGLEVSDAVAVEEHVLATLVKLVAGGTEAARGAERFPTAPALQKYAGIAPVTERSGNKSWVHWRWACPKFVRQSIIEWVAQTVPRSFWAKAFYDSCRARGMRHQATLRALAFKWIRILHRCWMGRKPYDESRYLIALQKRQARLLKFAATAPA